MSFQTCMSLFLMWNLKEDILKNAGNKTVVGPCWFKTLRTSLFYLFSHLADYFIQMTTL